MLATALFGKPAFRDVIVTGMSQAEDGKKMSKRLKNYPDPWEVMTRVGSDSLRFYLLSSPVLRAEQLNFSEKDCEALQRALLGILWNVRTFYTTYAGNAKVEIRKPRSAHVLDRWIFSRLMSLGKEMTEAMDGYDLVEATRPLRLFVDDLSTWWLRRSRDRIKGARCAKSCSRHPCSWRRSCPSSRIGCIRTSTARRCPCTWIGGPNRTSA